jgi:hypothetical protein
MPFHAKYTECVYSMHARNGYKTTLHIQVEIEFPFFLSMPRLEKHFSCRYRGEGVCNQRDLERLSLSIFFELLEAGRFLQGVGVS